MAAFDHHFFSIATTDPLLVKVRAHPCFERFQAIAVNGCCHTNKTFKGAGAYFASHRRIDRSPKYGKYVGLIHERGDNQHWNAVNLITHGREVMKFQCALRINRRFRRYTKLPCEVGKIHARYAHFFKRTLCRAVKA